MSDGSFSSEQTEILRGTWQSIKDLGVSLGGKIDQTREQRSAITRMEMRLATEIVNLNGTMQALVDSLKAHQADAARLSGCEQSIRDLDRRVTHLERPVS